MQVGHAFTNAAVPKCMHLHRQQFIIPSSYPSPGVYYWWLHQLNLQAEVVDVGARGEPDLSTSVSCNKDGVVSSGLGVKECLQSLSIIVPPSDRMS